MLTVGSLFSGIGGFDLGLERTGFTIEWQVENDEYCRQVLRKHWPHVPCHYDITTIDWHWIPRVDLVCGGFPCQPFSCAGKQRGAADDRYLWPEVVRCLSVLKPTWFVGENVPGLLHVGIEQVLADLAALGYEAQVLGIPACAVEAPHIRQRLWILAYSQHSNANEQRLYRTQTDDGKQSIKIQSANEQSSFLGQMGEAVADAEQQQWDGWRNWVGWWAREPAEAVRHAGLRGGQAAWMSIPESQLGRVADGIPHRVDRLRSLGNAIVPQIAEAVGRMILEVHK